MYIVFKKNIPVTEYFLHFFSDQVDEEAEKIRQERLAAYEAKKSKSRLNKYFCFLEQLVKEGIYHC